MRQVPPVPALLVSHLGKAYRAGMGACTAYIDVLRSVSFSVRPGELVIVDGAAGAGKTTLLRCLAGLLRPDAGTVSWPDLEHRPGRPPRGIALAVDRRSPYAFLTVRESLAYAGTVCDLDDPGTATDADELIEMFDLRAVSDVRLGLLGAGDRARVQLATALVSGPRLLLIDDIDGGPNAPSRDEFTASVAAVAARGVAVVWAARSLDACGVATCAYTLANGELYVTDAKSRSRNRRKSLELDVPVADLAIALLAPRLPFVESAGRHVRVALDRTSAEEVLALCRELSIPVAGSRVVFAGESGMAE